MTPDEVLAFARGLPPTVTRVEFHDDPPHGQRSPDGQYMGHVVIEQAAPSVVRAAPEIGDVERAQKAKEAQRPSDIESLGVAPPEWKD
jgi:hypothetical protein